MAAVALECRHGRERVCRALDELAGLDVAEVVGRQIGQQSEPHVGRRSAVRDHRYRMFLEVVRRQPMIFGADEGFEKCPRPARQFLQEDNLLVAEFCFAAYQRPADPPRDGRRRQPQEKHGCCDRQRARPGGQQPSCGR